ncbi:phage virion morphogenesis protein [Sphingobium sp. SCG-1]|uniref:phage virion morphogenesis protein n=1 Tax=Sphingobium sp. SCG-1 TaxID=2072936 RepID=UPI000CD683C8|nr:phage virion morphogenesis protein [Sphingobium sp. SCG-1]AUW59446.1 phage virion morphogenesis protein [Sphingobium sp. SCG-1]
MTGAGELAELEGFVGGVLKGLDSSGRRTLLRKVARDIRREQSARIAAQKNPDGSSFVPRKKRQPQSEGPYAVRFLYPSGGAPRAVFMKSWVREGPLLTGYDIEAGGMRSFFWDKITHWLGVRAEDQNKSAGKLRRRSTIRQRAMFRRLQGAVFLRSGASGAEAWAGFAGRVAAVAEIHQEGLSDRPSVNSKEVRYPMRELLGLSAEDRQRLLDAVIMHLIR